MEDLQGGIKCGVIAAATVVGTAATLAAPGVGLGIGLAIWASGMANIVAACHLK